MNITYPSKQNSVITALQLYANLTLKQHIFSVKK